jgi:hypothetical protein
MTKPTYHAPASLSIGLRLCLLMLPVLLIATACKSGKNANKEATAGPAPTEPLIRLEKGACFGTCPVFALDVYADGRVDFFPRLFTAIDTAASAQWDVAPILQAFDQAGLDELQDSYLSPIADLPTFTLRYGDSRIRWNAQAPEVLYTLMNMLDERALRQGWLLPPETRSDD